jgi:hypothetical protein
VESVVASGLVLAFCLVPGAAGARADAPLPEANALLQGLAERQRAHEEAVNKFTSEMHEVEEQLDKNGAVKKSVTRDYEVFYVQGRRVKRQVAENGVAYTPERLAKEDKEVQKRIKQILARKAAGKSDGTPLSAVLARFDFRSVAREDVEGRPAIVLEFTPLPGKRDLEGDWALRKLGGRIWVDELDREIVRAELQNTSKIKVGLGLLASVSTFRYGAQFREVEDGVWLPVRLETQAAGRLALVKGFSVRTTQTYDSYRRFQVDTEERVEPSEPQP